MPPPSRDSAAPAPTSRGSRYLSCASSTCSLPSRVRARRAKMSRISCVRSMILRPTCFFDVAQLRRRQLVVEDRRRRRRFRRTTRPASAILPAPRKVDGSGFGRSCSTRSTTSRAGGLGEAGELVERSLGVEPPRAARNQADERRAFAPAAAPARYAARMPDISLPGIAPARISRGVASGHVDNRRRRPARRRGRRRAADRSARRACRSTSSGSSVGGSAADGSRSSPSAAIPHAAAQRARHGVRRHAHADAAGAAGHLGRPARRRRHQQRQRAGPEARRKHARAARQHAELRRDLLDVGGDQRQRALRRAPFTANSRATARPR